MRSISFIFESVKNEKISFHSLESSCVSDVTKNSSIFVWLFFHRDSHTFPWFRRSEMCVIYCVWWISLDTHLCRLATFAFSSHDLSDDHQQQSRVMKIFLENIIRRGENSISRINLKHFFVDDENNIHFCLLIKFSSSSNSLKDFSSVFFGSELLFFLILS